MGSAAVAVILAAAILLSGCGGGDDDSSLATPTATKPQISGETVTPPTSTPILVATPTPTGVYVVQAGDTLGGIAKRFNVSLEDLLAANDIENPDRISVGLELQIPTPTPG